MSWEPEYTIAISILFAAVIVAKAIEDGVKALVKSIDWNSKKQDAIADRLERIGSRVGDLWSPLKGINNRVWSKDGDGERLAVDDDIE